MSTELAKETDFGAAFRERISGERDAGLRTLRERAYESFASKGFPTPRDEDWKYTNVASAVGGPWSVAPASVSEPNAVVELIEKFDFERNGFAALNLAFVDLKVVVIPKHSSTEEPISFEFIAADGEAIFPHVIVVAEPGSKATIVETYGSTGRSFSNAAIQVFVGDDANLTHYRVQKDSAASVHYGVTEVTVGRGSVYNSTNINLGGALSRHDIEVKFTAEGGEAFVDGLYMLSGSQHHDTHSVIDHTVPNCRSHQTYRGVLNDSSRGVFNGKVFVRENARGTDAEQSNKNLLLSHEARVDTKPQLEIFNDDVKCSHGATVGQLEEEELFYLLTRGLPEPLARNLLTYGFAEEIINKIGVESIKTELDRMVLNRLGTKI